MALQVGSTTPVTGQFAALVLIQGASTPFVGGALVPQPAQPRNDRIFPPGTCWKLGTRSQKIIDPTAFFTPNTSFIVKNNGGVVPAQNYIHLGGGDLYFPNGAPTIGGSPTAEVQSLAVTGTPTSANIPLKFGNVSTTLAYTAATTAASVQTALRALPTIGATGVTVTGSAGGPYAITYAGPLAAGLQPLIDVTGATFVAGTSPAVAVTETTPGTAALTLDSSYLSTSGSFDQYTIAEATDYTMTPTSDVVTSMVYGQRVKREFPSAIGVAFTFSQNSVNNILYSYQQTSDVLTVAAYESTISSTPRLWVFSGGIKENALDAKFAGMVGGAKAFACLALPYFLGETL